MNKKVQLGKTDLYVNPIGLGTNAVGGHNLYPNLDEEVGKEVVRTAIQNGVNFIDTALSYGPKRSEELIGEVIKEMGARENIILATKGAHKYLDNGVVMDNSPDHLKKSVEESLKRLQTDYIDLYYIHAPDEDTPKDEAVGALQQLKDEGKIRAIGVSKFSMDQIKEANKDGYLDVYQGEYNLLNREAEKELFPYLLEQQISFVPFFPLAAGLLAGKYNEQTKFNDLRENMAHLQGEELANNLKKVEKLREIANRKGVEIAHLVLAWYLSNDVIDAIIPGAKRPEQVLDNLKTLDVSLSQEEIKEIGNIF